MDASLPVPTVTELRVFVKASEGTEFSTLHQDRKFMLNASQGRVTRTSATLSDFVTIRPQREVRAK